MYVSALGTARRAKAWKVVSSGEAETLSALPSSGQGVLPLGLTVWEITFFVVEFWHQNFGSIIPELEGT